MTSHPSPSIVGDAAQQQPPSDTNDEAASIHTQDSNEYISSDEEEEELPPGPPRGKIPIEDYAFCCFRCRCDIQVNVASQCHFEDDGYWHRHCCHDIQGPKVEETWMPPVEVCFEQVTRILSNLDKKEGDTEGDAEDPGNAYVDNVREDQEKATQTEASLSPIADNRADELATLYSNASYQRFCDDFHACVNRRQERMERKVVKEIPKAHVLDLFSGVGSGLHVLKKLSLRMYRYTFVDHDRLAKHVMRENHNGYTKEGYGRLNPIGYFDYPDFEGLETHLDMVLHKPVDIILASPPFCNNDAGNANAHKYLLRTMNLIQAIKAHPKQRRRSFFCMVEYDAVSLSHLQLTQVSEIFGCPPITLDAQDFSPCRRKRHYWVNYPLDENDFTGPGARCVPHLEDGWTMLQDIGAPQAAKANTFMSSPSRLDDYPRMAKVKKFKGQYKRSTFSLKEREWMMGYPEGYFSKTIDELYATLFEFVGARSLSHQKQRWHEQLHQRFWRFSGARYYNFVVAGSRENSHVVMKMAPHTPSMEKGPYFTSDEMGKHLIGEAHSVPVLEYLLRPLTALFPRKRTYKRMKYGFHWKEDEAPIR